MICFAPKSCYCGQCVPPLAEWEKQERAALLSVTRRCIFCHHLVDRGWFHYLSHATAHVDRWMGFEGPFYPWWSSYGLFCAGYRAWCRIHYGANYRELAP